MDNVSIKVIQFDSWLGENEAVFHCLERRCQHEERIKIPRRKNAILGHKCPKCRGEFYQLIVELEDCLEFQTHFPPTKKRKR